MGCLFLKYIEVVLMDILFLFPAILLKTSMSLLTKSIFNFMLLKFTSNYSRRVKNPSGLLQGPIIEGLLVRCLSMI